MSSDSSLLSLLIWIPIVGGLLTLAVGDRRGAFGRVTALTFAMITLLISLALWNGFDRTTHLMQFVEMVPWIEPFNINYHLGVDGISMPFIVLTSFITVIVVIAGWEVIQDRNSQYMAAFLMMTGLMNGV
ncbi:MAG: NADH-quinone oxidoreductase subunit M, partial [Gammaproteobacteria bacterium]|nr:NADH-quinone oxidoreductase subunit M [Gammaproteobacteria bacterium]